MIETKNNFIEFGFDPFKFIEDGLKIVTDNNLRSEATESRVARGEVFLEKSTIGTDIKVVLENLLLNNLILILD
jgi:hypothetical protein